MSGPVSLDQLQRGDRLAVAKALNVVDDGRRATREQRAELLGTLFRQPREGVQLVGITGPPGVGKSTLTARLIQAYRARSLRVGILAVDPSSRKSGGALLGDRIRMQLSSDDGVFIRSLATRNHLGGLSAATYPAKVVLASAFDRVLVESVGVGQSETEIADAVDSVLLVLQPASGDSIQFIKSGIMEVPEFFVLNKTDLPESSATYRELRATLRAAAGVESPADDAQPRLLRTAAAHNEGIEELVDALEGRFAAKQTAGRLTQQRQAQWQRWLELSVRERYGTAGLEQLGGSSGLPQGVGGELDPFTAYAQVAERLDRQFGLDAT